MLDLPGDGGKDGGVTDPEELRTRAASIFERLRQGGGRKAPLERAEGDESNPGTESRTVDDSHAGDGTHPGIERPAGDTGDDSHAGDGSHPGIERPAGDEGHAPDGDHAADGSHTGGRAHTSDEDRSGDEHDTGVVDGIGEKTTGAELSPLGATDQSPSGDEVHGGAQALVGDTSDGAVEGAQGDEQSGSRPTLTVMAKPSAEPSEDPDSAAASASPAESDPPTEPPTPPPAQPSGSLSANAGGTDQASTTQESSGALPDAAEQAAATSPDPSVTAKRTASDGAAGLPQGLPSLGAAGEDSRPDDWRGRRPLPRIFAIANQKGGVGKTTTAVNLGAALAELGYRVLVIDLDPQGNATTGLGINARNLDTSIYDVLLHDVGIEDCIEPTSLRNLFVVPATIDLAGAEIELVPVFSRELRLRRAVERIKDDFDFTLIDCPPSLGLLTVNGLAAATEVVVPIQCEYYALEGLGQLLRNVNLVSANLNPTLEVTTIILTMYDARTRLAEQVVTEVRSHFGDRVCRSVVPRTVRLSEAPSFGQPIIVFDSSSRGAIAYRELAKEVSGGAPQRVG
jgi:chromosome partitioning protein